MLETVMLHHVVSRKRAHIGPLADYAVSPADLDAYLQRRTSWTALSGGERMESVHEGDYYLLTFDDGYRNTLTEALPVLERHDVPCVLFVTTGFIDGEVYPYEVELAEVIERADDLRLPDRSRPIELDGPSQRRALYREVRLPLKPRGREARAAFMERLADLNGYERAAVQEDLLLSWEEVRELSAHPLVTIGAHTQSHVLLSRQSWRAAYRELEGAKMRLEEHLGKEVDLLSYPYGGNTVVVRQMARWLGYRNAFTTRPARADRIGGRTRLSIPRIDINEFVTADG